GSGVGLFLAPGFFVGSGDSVRFGFGVESSSSSLVAGFGFALALGDSSGSGVGLFFAAGVRFGFGDGCFLVFDLRLAGFGFALGSGVSSGVGEGTARISSRALVRASRFFFSSSLSCAWTRVTTIPLRARRVPRKTRKRITAGERNRAEEAINPEGLRGELARDFGVKRAGAWRSPQLSPRARVRDGESRLVFRREAKANRSNTSRSAGR
ncbi:MAG: hypothetical protein QOE34_2308, partial [Verrucomicrobiota bacterium]